MNRFHRKKETKANRIVPFLPIVFVLAVTGCIYNGISSVSLQMNSQQKKSLEEAVHRDMVACYAMEGVYPPDLEYLKEHYGLTYDEDRYIVSYEALGSNLMPDVTVMEKRAVSEKKQGQER